MAFDFFPLNVFFSSLKTSVSNQIDGLTINKSDYSVLTKSLICSDCNEEQTQKSFSKSLLEWSWDVMGIEIFTMLDFLDSLKCEQIGRFVTYLFQLLFSFLFGAFCVPHVQIGCTLFVRHWSFNILSICLFFF